MSADEIANLLARLETAQLEIPVYDTARRNYNSTVRLISGKPSRALIAKDCKTVGKLATFLPDKLCIELVRLAHLLKNKGVWPESDDHKKDIMNYWNSMKSEFTDSLTLSHVDQKNKTISDKMSEIQSEMDEYTRQWKQTFDHHTTIKTQFLDPVK
jgi:hypothetical protein